MKKKARCWRILAIDWLSYINESIVNITINISNSNSQELDNTIYCNTLYLLQHRILQGFL